MKKTLIALCIALGAITLSGCKTDADVVSENLSKEANFFEINRRIVFYNGITDKYMLTIEGKCSITVDNRDNQLEVTCKTDDGYKKHFLGLSDNVTYFAEQIEPSDVSKNFYKVIFKPSTIIPNIEVK